MTGQTKPAAWGAAGSRIVLSCPAKHPENRPATSCDQEARTRHACLRTLADVVSMGASEAPSRESRERLHAATACIFDALAIERRSLQCGRLA